MISDRRFIKVDNGFPEHAKTGDLSDRAFRRLIEAWCFCSRNLNDGRITNAQKLKLFSQKVSSELVDAGFMHRTADGWEMHDYLDHQMSAEQVADLQRKRAEAGRRGGNAKANRVASATAKAKQTPSKPVADIDVDGDIDKEPTTKSSASPTAMVRPRSVDAEFDEFWKAYPRKVGKDGARRVFANVLRQRRATAAELIAGAVRYAADPNLEPEFTAHPQTWLNRGRWTDETPLPAKGSPAAVNGYRPSTSEQRAGQARDLAAELRAAETGNVHRLEIRA